MSIPPNLVEISDAAAPQRPRYRAISEYGAIGDCRTAALVAPDGAIDWCCLPHFDSPALFCRLLDADRGGYFQITPADAPEASVSYLDGTNILETIFTSQSGRVRLIDFMPIRHRHRHLGEVARPILENVKSAFRQGPAEVVERDIGNDVAAAHRLTRIATVLEGEVALDLTLKATFDYARQAAHIRHIPQSERIDSAILSAGNRYLAFVLRRDGDSIDLPPVRLATQDGVLRARVALRAGQRMVAMLNYARNLAEAQALVEQLYHQPVDTDIQETMHYWSAWSSQCRYHGRYRREVLRSALALKLCTFEPTGAIVAAPTTSLPEAPGGPRNWDYRYSWLRDSSFTIEALDGLGYIQEARDYCHFLHDLHVRNGMNLRIMYTISGETDGALDEHELTHLEGYSGSRPVRIGNGAASQRQMDVYGELVQAAYRYLQRAGFSFHHPTIGASRNVIPLIRKIANYVADHWQEPDQGIWEVRGEPRAFVYSRVMCWVALDIAYRVAHGRNSRRWAAARDRIREDILEHGFDREFQSFVQAYGSRALDAANLRLPLVGFLPATDRRMQSTIAATIEELSGPRGLLYRYRTRASMDDGASQIDATDDGLAGSEGAFAVCTFWLIDDLCLQGRVDEARERFESLLRLASPLGLFAEEIDFQTGAQLGNYPQALTHIGLVKAAIALDRAAGDRPERTSEHVAPGQPPDA
jgi:GH15 family glucan-1,4-alpha-glucosidase